MYARLACGLAQPVASIMHYRWIVNQRDDLGLLTNEGLLDVLYL